MSPTLLGSAFVITTLLLNGSLFGQAPATPAPKPKATPPPVLDQLGIKLIPQPGVAIPEADRAELTAGVAELGRKIDALRAALKAKPDLLALLPDVMIFHKAVDWALRYNEFFNVKQVGTAKQQLALGHQRAAELKDGKPAWITATGLVPRGYISKIDGSVQPYGMVIPEDWKPGEKVGRRLDFWAHGRGETLSELAFLDERLTKKGEFTPPGTLVLHLYGRYCNANKFAGEVDLFEALDHAHRTYHIDRNKLVVRGFSMGGAAVWQFGTHFAGMWAVVQPGAGFAETREFNKVYAPGKTAPTWWEEVLYRWYDATDIVGNLSNTTTIAYSGETDGQKQAADIMIRAARMDAGNAHPPAAEPGTVAPGDGSPSIGEARVTGTAPDVEFYHVIGPQTAHKIKPESKPEIEAMIDDVLARPAAQPKKVRFTTYSLIYPEMEWVRVEGLEKQWERAEVSAEVQGDKIVATTKNVTALRFPTPLGDTGPASDRIKSVVVDGQTLPAGWNKAGARFHRAGGKWAAGVRPGSDLLGGKQPGLCGPIDHAFMDKFLFVRPTGQPLNAVVGAWAAGELEHALGFWRKVFRGEAPAKDDTAITDADLASSHLVLWGDPSSNAVLKRILAQAAKADSTRPFPIEWTGEKLLLGGQSYDATHTALVLIFPNPLSPSKYIVLNSGPTFREDALLNNSQQIPKLPDWAIIDVNTPPDGKWPGKVLNAGFFDEQWKTPGK
jgi:hypothetical protein